MDIHVLFLMLEEMLSFFTAQNDLTLGCHMAFIILRFPSCPLSGEFLSKVMLRFIKSFFCVSWDDYLDFILQLLVWCIKMIDLLIFKSPCITGINPTWSWVVILLMYYWIFFANILLIIFSSLFISGYWPVIFFLWYLWFWYQGDGGLIQWAWEYSFLCNFLEEYQKDRC